MFILPWSINYPKHPAADHDERTRVEQRPASRDPEAERKDRRRTTAAAATMTARAT